MVQFLLQFLSLLFFHFFDFLVVGSFRWVGGAARLAVDGASGVRRGSTGGGGAGALLLRGALRVVLEEDLLEQLDLRVLLEQVEVRLHFRDRAQNVKFRVAKVVYVLDVALAFLLGAVICAKWR